MKLVFFLFKGFLQTAARFNHSETLNTDSVTLLVWLHYKLRLSSENVYDGIETWNQSFVLFSAHWWFPVVTWNNFIGTCEQPCLLSVDVGTHAVTLKMKNTSCVCIWTVPTHCPVTWQQSVCFGQIATVLIPMIHFWCIYLLHWNLC